MAKGLGYWYIELEKQAYWRGNPHSWVNRYVMSGDDPTATAAQEVIGDLMAIENVLHAEVASGLGVGFVQGRAYSKNGGPPLAVVNYNESKAAGTATGFTGGTYDSVTLVQATTLEQCLETRTPLATLSSSGKPVYLRKFFRGVSMNAEQEVDAPNIIPAGVITALSAVIQPWKTGLGSNSYVVIGTSGRQASGDPTFVDYFSNHQVPRGRKKKS